MDLLRVKLKDSLLMLGLVLVLGSCFFFCFPFLFNTDPGGYPGLFMLNYFFVIIYFISIIGYRKSGLQEHKIHYTFFLLILLLISAYSLNREMTVFDSSPVWFCVLLCILCTNYIASIFFYIVPQWLRVLILFLLGVSVVVFLYLSIYLMPLYVFSVVALIALGISIHSFVPALLLVYTFLLTVRFAYDKSKYWVSFGSGAGAAIMIAIVFTIVWKSQLKDLNRAYTKATSEGNSDVPAWIQVAQHVKDNSINEKILKTDLVYVVPHWDMGSDLFWRTPGRSFGEEQKIHDPLVVFASVFSGNVFLNQEDRINILKSQFNSRHQAEERLWTGKDLRTLQVSSNINIWPDLHLAYTEKVITVYNQTMHRGWSRDEEALYTFHLPEGGVVTSLSLWINGKEEKGVLTTKEKADSAYKTIVGVESRDPSVVHWQEGNRVSVRVFPVASSNSRVFKIGVTTPLRKEGNQLAYDNIWFDGPDVSSAEENVKINFVNPVKNITRQASFESINENTCTRSGKYRPHWTYWLNDETLAPKSFSFNKNRYSITPYQAQKAPFDCGQVYLDINASWTQDEFDSVWSYVKNRKVWVYQDGLVQLTEANHQQLFDEMNKLQFSLFPIFTITDPAHSLLITKTGTSSPNLSDLQGSNFWDNMKLFSSRKEKVNMFNIDQNLSPYLSSLQEYRFFQYERGSLPELQQLLASGQFISDQENEQQVVIHSANVSIVKEEGEGPSNAPDHLMRLFAYNHIMQQLGKKGISGTPGNEQLVADAAEANVVSPVSSLVVLETKDDYERFGIEQSKESLKNASIKSKGAVPEPHEWLIIILAAIIAIYLFVKTKI